MTFYSEKTIYEHTDSDGDSLRVAVTPISVRFYREGPNEYAGLNRDRVLELHEALVGWLYPNHTPEAPNHSLIEQMIERAVKDQITAILPLHLSPLALKSDAERAREAKDGSEQCRGGYGCDTLGVHAAYGSCCGRPDPEPHGEYATESKPGLCRACGDQRPRLSLIHQCSADPEPRDVGHPTYEDARPEGLCIGCALGSHPHVFAPCSHCLCQAGAVDPEPQDHGRLMTELPRRTPRPPCGGCSHTKGEHMAGMCWGDRSCMCPEYTAPVPVTESDKVWGEQGEPPAPVALECVCDKHNHRPVVREGSPATCAYRNCGCGYRSTP